MPMKRTRSCRRKTHRIRIDMIVASELMSESLITRTRMSGARGTQVREAHLVSASDLMSESLRTRTPIDSPMSGARGTQVREAHPVSA